MKIEIVKETSLTGVWYSIEEDGKYVEQTSRRDLADVEELFEALKKKESIPKREIIRSEEI